MARAGREINKGLLLSLIVADQWLAFPRITTREYVVQNKEDFIHYGSQM